MNQALGKTGKGPFFPSNSRKPDKQSLSPQKPKFWNSLKFLSNFLTRIVRWDYYQKMITIDFLGISPCIPDNNGDTASYMIGGELLLDTGWYATGKLRAVGIKPGSIKHLCFTHMHHDHILGLPALLFENYRNSTIEELTVYGPNESVASPVEDSIRFLQAQLFWPNAGLPRIKKLTANDSFETNNLLCQVIPSVHAVPGRCYRITDKNSGVSAGFGGDGTYQKALVDFFKGCDVLVLEFSRGTDNSPANPGKHSSIQESARLAEEAGAKMLCPVHGPPDQIEQ
jgi:ribonuclease BN (tRNA processing enzyme)